jgi:predicted dehydrogenase
MTLRTTIVGCGAVAQRLYRKPLQALDKSGLVRVHALVEPVAHHAETFGAFFPKAARYADLDEALSASQSELTLILSPAHLHSAQAVKVLQSGSHVLCEKPMASTPEECARMNAAAVQAKRVLAIGMVRRFFPAYAQLCRLLQDDQLGRLLAFDYREGHKFDWDVTTPAAFRPRREGGTGVLFDIGPHAIDHLSWTIGDLTVSSYRDDALAGIESNAHLDVVSRACRGIVRLSWNDPQSNELRVIGERGEAVLRVGQFSHLAVRRSSTFEPQRIDVSFAADAEARPKRRLTPGNYQEAIYCQIVQTIRAIALSEPPAVDGRSGEACIALLTDALTKAEPQEMPWLQPAHQSAVRRLHWSQRA